MCAPVRDLEMRVTLLAAAPPEMMYLSYPALMVSIAAMFEATRAAPVDPQTGAALAWMVKVLPKVRIASDLAHPARATPMTAHAT